MGELMCPCKHCGGLLFKVSSEPDDQRYRHAATKEYTCDLPPDANGWYKNAVPKTGARFISQEEQAEKILAAAMAEGEERRIRFEKAMAEGDTNYILWTIREQARRYRDE